MVRSHFTYVINRDSLYSFYKKVTPLKQKDGSIYNRKYFYIHKSRDSSIKSHLNSDSFTQCFLYEVRLILHT